MEALLTGPLGQTLLGLNSVTIGRMPTNQIVIPNDPRVSGRHAEIRPDAQGYLLSDLGSVNGTFVNGQRLTSNIPYVLKVGDTIRIGQMTFCFQVRGAYQMTSLGHLPQPQQPTWQPPGGTWQPPLQPQWQQQPPQGYPAQFMYAPQMQQPMYPYPPVQQWSAATISPRKEKGEGNMKQKCLMWALGVWAVWCLVCIIGLQSLFWGMVVGIGLPLAPFLLLGFLAMGAKERQQQQNTIYVQHLRDTRGPTHHEIMREHHRRTRW